MQTIHFNTGRKYTQHGQRISATLRDDGVVTFYDHDRLIHGQFDLQPFMTLGRETVMEAYDSGLYEITSQSYLDGMMSGGPNCPTAFQRYADAEARFLSQREG